MQQLKKLIKHPKIIPLPNNLKMDRLDKVLAFLLKEYSRNTLQKLVREGLIRVNGLLSKPRKIISASDVITILAELETANYIIPMPINFSVIEESEDWILINKPAGLVTHPGINNLSNTLLHGLLFYYPELDKIDRGGIIHRLDKNTSGLMIIARTLRSRTCLINQWKSKSIRREYRALVHGNLNAKSVVNKPIGRDPINRTRMTTKNPINPRNATTHYIPIFSGYIFKKDPITEIICYLETGRTHQIRSHMSGIGHPLLGDTLYGGKYLDKVKRQMLHSKTLGFHDPNSGKFLFFSSDLPSDMLNVKESIEWKI